MVSVKLTALALAGLALLDSAAAQPFHGRRRHHAKRDAVVVTTTVATVYVNGATVRPESQQEPVYVTVTSAAVETAAAPAYTPSAAVSVNNQESPVIQAEAAAATTIASSPAGYAAPAASSTTSAAAAGSSSYGSTKKVAGSGKSGIAYSPYNSDHSCKSKDDVAADIQKIADYGIIRLYGTDCDQVANVLAAVKSSGQKIFAGIYDVTKYQTELKTLTDAVGSDWDAIHTVAIGNEVVNSGLMSASQFAGYINDGRQQLRSAGYNGPVVGVDTFVAIMNNPEICDASDYVAANCHPFFDGNVEPSGSGKFLDDMKSKMAEKCGSKDIMITESGWPHQGEANKVAVPSVDNQKTAIESILSTQGSNVILFTAFDDKWKQNTAATFDAEQYWGIVS